MQANAQTSLAPQNSLELVEPWPVQPLVTITIPTYNRPTALKRALESAVRQDYPNLEILVSDNHSEGGVTDVVVEPFLETDTRITYFKQPENIGGAANFRFLIDRAQGKYLVLLGDDDALSERFVSQLVEVLEREPETACVFAPWRKEHLDRSEEGRTVEYASKSRLLRISKYLFNPYDIFCCGMHRRELFQSIPFRRWLWPNRNVMANAAYPILFNILCTGRVRLVEGEGVTLHKAFDSKKFYSAGGRRFWGIFQFLVRRINLYLEYLRRSLEMGQATTFLSLLLLAPFAWLNDLRVFAGKFIPAFYRKYILRQRAQG